MRTSIFRSGTRSYPLFGRSANVRTSAGSSVGTDGTISADCDSSTSRPASNERITVAQFKIYGQRDVLMSHRDHLSALIHAAAVDVFGLPLAKNSTASSR
jgi:hypothetical protein